MQPLKSLIENMIRQNGPMRIDQYWSLCLAHQDYGYYKTRDPLGAAGDFTTAPEISQLFGEMVGIWVAEEWIRLSSPQKIHLVECGPGRGTLMADILRVIKIVPGCLDAVQVHLVETSPALKEKQRQTLPSIKPVWHDSLETLPDDAPLLFVANEFFDALPIRQFICGANGWQERVIALSGDGALCFAPGSVVLANNLPSGMAGDIFEWAPAREAVASEMGRRLKNQGGSGLFIDYGHPVSALGDTLQAVSRHKFENILDKQGDADITSHVDFGTLALQFLNQEAIPSCCTQKEFLERMGIGARAAQLERTATSEDQKEAIKAGLSRLIDKDAMGELFKVLEVRS